MKLNALFKQNSVRLATLACLATSSMSAQAVVMNWDYTVNSAFTASTFAAGTTNIATSANSLSWGSGNNGSSSLVLGNNPAAGNVDTFFGVNPPNAPPFRGFSTSITHNNNVISLPSSLLTATLSSTLVLDPTNPNNPALAPQNINFTIGFKETVNQTPCVVSGSPVPCNDIFVLTGGLLNSSFIYDDGTGPSQYFVNIFPVSGGILGTLTNAECAAAGEANGCVGFTTPENQNTTLRFGFAVSTQPLTVPEPGSLALAGLGLLGLAGLRSRRNRK